MYRVEEGLVSLVAGDAVTVQIDPPESGAKTTSSGVQVHGQLLCIPEQQEDARSLSAASSLKRLGLHPQAGLSLNRTEANRLRRHLR
jgi:hypothetical protein